MNTHKLTPLAAILLFTISSAFSQSPPKYSVLDLGSIGGSFSAAQGINNSGQVVGYFGSLNATENRFYNRGFLYSGGTITDLGTLGGSSTVPSAINDVGQVVGYSTALIPAPNPCANPDDPNYDPSFCDPNQNPDAPDPNAPYFVEEGHAFLYSNGSMTDLGVLPNAGSGASSASDINNSGQIVGYSAGPPDPYYGPQPHGFLYSGGSMTDLGDLGGGFQTFAFAINNSGQIAGFSDIGLNQRRAFLYSGGTMNNLGTLGGSQSEAYGINDSGQVVGYARTGTGEEHAFLYSGGTMTDLGTLGGSRSDAYAINNTGHVVGSYYGRGFQPFLYTGGTMYDLLTLCTDCGAMGEVIATGVNDSGQIVARGAHAFVFRPIASSTAGVPVTSTVASNTSYTVVAPVTNSTAGSDNTNVALIGGTATSPKIVNVTFSSSAPSGFQAASDVVNISGTGSDTIVLQVSYNETQAISVFGTEDDTRLMWLDPSDSQWKLAVVGNAGGTPQLVSRAYDPATDFQLGNYGVDTANNVVWAVINHNSAFAVGKAVPIVYNATVQQPINLDGSSVFNANRGVVPVKFALTQNGSATCSLPPATIALTRTAGTTTGTVNESAYTNPADSGSNFKIEGCKYGYNLAAKGLGAGSYRVDIKINNQVAGSAIFKLK
jgi:probable HAF family extracellular repeat protein